MKRTLIIACLVLAAVALLVAPALAAPPPSPLHKVTWRGSGICGDNPALIDEITGTTVKFSGSAIQDGAEVWSGRGTMVDRSGKIKADLVVQNGNLLSADQVYLMGEATITADGVTYEYVPFGLTLDTSTSEYQLFVEQTTNYIWLWWVPGSAFKGNIQIT